MEGVEELEALNDIVGDMALNGGIFLDEGEEGSGSGVADGLIWAECLEGGYENDAVYLFDGVEGHSFCLRLDHGVRVHGFAEELADALGRGGCEGDVGDVGAEDVFSEEVVGSEVIGVGGVSSGSGEGGIE